MEKEHINNGYESSAKFVFYAFGGILLIILTQAIEQTIILFLCILLAGIIYLISKIISSIPKPKSKAYKKGSNLILEKNKRHLKPLLILMSKREKEEISGDLEEISESLKKNGYSNFKIKKYLFKHIFSIFIIQIKLFFIKLFGKEKNKEIDQ